MAIGDILTIYEKTITINTEILNLISQIDIFKGNWMALRQLAPERLDSLRKIATIESVASSTRIEGVALTDSQVRTLLSGMQINSFKNRDEEEVAGYAETMNLVFESYNELIPTENIIKQLHQVLLQYSTKDERHRGIYKKLNNNVEAFGANGKNLGIIFKTASPMETPYKMEDLCNWLNTTLTESKVHPLLVISKFVVTFLAIHPFQDGNGRLSRILTTLLLSRTGFHYVFYSSLERIIEENKRQYYLTLRSAQTEPKNSNKGLSIWVTFFLESLVKQKNILSKKLEEEQKLLALPELSELIITRLKEHGRLSLSQIVSLTGGNRNTVKSHLFKLVKAKQIQKSGRGRGTVYLYGTTCSIATSSS